MNTRGRTLPDMLAGNLLEAARGLGLLKIGKAGVFYFCYHGLAEGFHPHTPSRPVSSGLARNRGAASCPH